MGWNSFNCFGSAVTEAEVRANADYLARHLRQYGWDTVVVDYCWAHPHPGPCFNPNQGPGAQPFLAMDRYNRLLPAPERFPSAAHGQGFKPLADYVHGLGLKFGIHIMRGLPKQAVYPDFPCLSGHRPSDFVNPTDSCSWLDHMVGVDPAKAGGQAYYDSLFALYASWGVDYIKVDDMSFPYHAGEIEAVRHAINRCGRPIIFSLSPGETPLTQAPHVATQANLWRISADFWDDWPRVVHMFDLCRDWAPHRHQGAWPDADMLPLGRLSKRGPCGPERDSILTPEEQRSMMTLWYIFRSPLMLGANLPELDAATLALLTHEEALAMHRSGVGGTEQFRADGWIVWAGEGSGGIRYVACFNLHEKAATAEFPLARVGWRAPTAQARDTWPRCDLGTVSSLKCSAPAHGCQLFTLRG
jgi:alpha-galactosidase